MPLLADIRYAARQLRKSPGFTAAAVLTLALCIGANTSIYSVVDAVLLRPLPYPEPDRLALITSVWHRGSRENVNTAQTGAQFEAVRDGAPALDVAAFSGMGGVNFTSGGVTRYVFQQRVSSGFFRVLGVGPELGREFTPAEDRRGGPAVAILSNNFWLSAFQHDPGVVGSAILLRGEPFTVIGIMPPSFRTDAPVDVWTPLRPSRTGEGGGSNYRVAARLRPTSTWVSAHVQLASVSRLLTEQNHSPQGITLEERLMPFQTGIASGFRTELLLTWIAVIIVLLIGCGNIAGLLLARSTARRREIATRLAIGGSRAAIVQQLLLESLLLALCGGVLGIALGRLGLDALKIAGADRFLLWHPLTLDLRVTAMMFSVTLFTSVLFGLIPAIQASSVDIRAVLVEGGRGAAGGRATSIRNLLVAAEVALTLVLLVSAGLLVRSLAYLTGLNPGFDTQNVLTAQTSLQDARYREPGTVNRLFTNALKRIREIPGVESAGVALTLPFERPLNDGFRTVDGAANDAVQACEMVYATSGYFETMRIPLLSGRTFRDADTAGSQKVVLVSTAFARKYFPRMDALGRHVILGKAPAEIVGIVGDVQQASGLGYFGPLSVQPTLYFPAAQLDENSAQVIHTWFPPKWVVRAHGSESSLAARIQQAVQAVDPQLPVAYFKSIDQLRAAATSEQRYHAVLFSGLAALAIVLSAVGLYGLISTVVAQRTRELGIRMALGATIGKAMAAAMRPGLVYASAGALLGAFLSFAAARVLRSLLWGVQPFDPVTFVVTIVVLLGVALGATALPALRLLSLDPAKTLRDE